MFSIKNVNFCFLYKIHGASAFTAFTPLLNLNLNYEKLHVKYTNSFKQNNYLKRFFMLFLFILGKIRQKLPFRGSKSAGSEVKITSPDAPPQEDFLPLFGP